jgi:nucleotide-binding universal stress UspA family protein
VSRGYLRILVPVTDNTVSEKAMDFAARLAAERHASVTAVTVIEVPPLLPLDADMSEEEEDAHRLLERVQAIAGSYGVGVSPRILRARQAASAIVEHATTIRAEIVVMGSARKRRRGSHAPVFGNNVQDVLREAPCRVMVIASRSGVDGRKADVGAATEVAHQL